MAEHVIPPNAWPDSPPHIDEFDPSYIIDYAGDVMEKRAIDTRQHQVINYMGKQKMVEAQDKTTHMWWQKILVLIIGFGMCFIPTSIPQSSSIARSPRL